MHKINSSSADYKSAFSVVRDALWNIPNSGEAMGGVLVPVLFGTNTQCFIALGHTCASAELG